MPVRLSIPLPGPFRYEPPRNSGGMGPVGAFLAGLVVLGLFFAYPWVMFTVTGVLVAAVVVASRR